MRQFFIILSVLLISLSSTSVKATEYLQMLNSYVSMKLHLSAGSGQMVGAAWIRVRNNSAASLTEIPYILNPGLQTTQVMGGGNTPLQHSSAITPISGYEFLEATAGTIKLANAVQPDKEAEVIIHYRGSLSDLSWTGLNHVKETLTSDFTIIRADSFAYPVLAEPNKAALVAAISQPAYYQTATVELGSGYKIAGNLHVGEQNTKGANIAFDLKHALPTAPMTLPIARYETQPHGPLNISYLPGSQTAAAALVSELSPEIDRLRTLLGAPSSSQLNITMVPDGYGHLNTTGLVMMEENSFSSDTVRSSGALLTLWGIGGKQKSGHWRNSLNQIISLAATEADTSAHAAALFTNMKTLLSSNKKLGKTAFAKFTENNWHQEAETQSGLILAGLYDIMGADAFFALVREIRSELRGNYADNAVFADFILDTVKHKQAKKFAKNWLRSKKAGKDMNKANSFEELIKRYK